MKFEITCHAPQKRATLCGARPNQETNNWVWSSTGVRQAHVWPIDLSSSMCCAAQGGLQGAAMLKELHHSVFDPHIGSAKRPSIDDYFGPKAPFFLRIASSSSLIS